MADDVGNLLGKRGTFVYEADSGELLNFSQDRSVGSSVGNALATTASTGRSVNTKYLQGRYILAQKKDDPTVKKRIVVGNKESALFTATATSEIIINAQIFVVTGRVGEQASYLKLTPVITPP